MVGENPAKSIPIKKVTINAQVKRPLIYAVPPQEKSSIGGAWVDFDDNGTDDVIYDLKEDQVVANGVFGYRFIGDYGFTFRLAFTPVYTKDGFQSMGGAMMGYAF